MVFVSTNDFSSQIDHGNLVEDHQKTSSIYPLGNRRTCRPNSQTKQVGILWNSTKIAICTFYSKIILPWQSNGIHKIFLHTV